MGKKRGKYLSRGGAPSRVEGYNLAGVGQNTLRVHVLAVGLEEASGLLQRSGFFGTLTPARRRRAADLAVTPGRVWDFRE
jgi:hypothetical protein